MDALSRYRASPPPPAHNFDDVPDELVGILEVYEGDDATCPVEAPPVAFTVFSDLSPPCVLVLDGEGGEQMSFRYMMYTPACSSQSFFGGEVGKYKCHACRTTTLLSFALGLLPCCFYVDSLTRSFCHGRLDSHAGAHTRRHIATRQC